MSEQIQRDVPAKESEPTGDEISLLDLLIVLAKHKRLVLGLPLVVAIAAAIVSLLLPNIYTGTTRILPPQQSASAATALLNQLGGAAGGLAGAASGALGIRNPNDLYVGMLKSRTVADNLIARFDLNRLYNQEFQSNTRKMLEGRTSIGAGRDGIITIEVDDKTPKLAAEIANAQVDAQGRSMIEVTARLRAQISSKEVQLSAMRSFAAEGNPELQRTQDELQALRRELGRIEGSLPVAGVGKGGEGGHAGLDNLGRLRDVKYYEFLYELLAKQYELAKIDEAKDATIIQVLDEAIEPDRKSKPRRTQIVLLSTIVALLASIIWAFIREAAATAGADPKQTSRIETLR